MLNLGLGLGLQRFNQQAELPVIPTVAATGVLSYNGNVSDGKIVTIGSTIYRYVTDLEQAYDVKIGSSASLTNLNFIAAINHSAGEGTEYGTGTLAHPDVTAIDVPGKMNVTAKFLGSAGNSIVTQSTEPNATWDAATLQGGA